MAHKVQVNAGQVQIALPDGEVYDGPVEVILTDDEFARIRSALFPTVLTDLGSLPDPDLDAEFVTEDELEVGPGAELGYAERVTTHTTTSLPTDDAALNNNLISGLAVTVTGRGRPVEIEAYVPVVAHSVIDGVCYLHLLIDGTQVGAVFVNVTTSKAGVTAGSLIAKRRLILTDGVDYTFTVGTSIDVVGTGTYYATPDIPMYLSVVQR